MRDDPPLPGIHKELPLGPRVGGFLWLESGGQAPWDWPRASGGRGSPAHAGHSQTLVIKSEHDDFPGGHSTNC